MKSLNIGINGFGRIGRAAARIILNDEHFRLSAINSRSDLSSHAYLLKYDTTYGHFPAKIETEEGVLKINGTKVLVSKSELPQEIPWGKAKVDIVLECSGKFLTQEQSMGHLQGSVSYVVLSVPAKDETPTFVLGVNEKNFNPSLHKIISNSSCTTNCLGPILSVLDRDLGIQRAFATTIHAVTDSQNLLDNSHKKEVRLRRSAMACLIPTSSGAGKDVAKILPHLAGKIFLRSLRIPLLTVSLIDLTAEISKKTSKEEVNQVFEKEAKGRLRQIIEVAQEEFVSSDFIGNPHSAIFDPFLTEVAQGNLVKVFAWYDNEWAYAQRLVDLAYYIAKKSHLYEN